MTKDDSEDEMSFDGSVFFYFRVLRGAWVAAVRCRVLCKTGRRRGAQGFQALVGEEDPAFSLSGYDSDDDFETIPLRTLND